jgi:uncharacterized protein with von Willebrand factor type A (vWA) domain
MISPILKFVSCCRAAGYRISTAEVLDCTAQLELIDLLDEEEFRAALRSNFAKSRRDQAHFDRLYHLFFHELRGTCPRRRGSRRRRASHLAHMGQPGGGPSEQPSSSSSRETPSLPGDDAADPAESDTVSLGTKFNLGPLSS